MEAKKNILTYEGLRKYEDELHELKVVKRQEVAQKIKEAREQGDLSENAEYDAAKDEQRDIEARIEAGATVFNISAGKETAKLVKKIRMAHPEFPIIATGGPTDETIKETIEAGANAITYTPPT